MTTTEKINPMGSREQQLAARQAFANACGIDISMVEVGPNGIARLISSQPRSLHGDNYYFNVEVPLSPSDPNSNA